jgi:hypothetical protein
LLWRSYEHLQTSAQHLRLVAPTAVRGDILDDLHAGAIWEKKKLETDSRSISTGQVT